MQKRFNLSNYRTRIIFLSLLMIGLFAVMLLIFLQSRQSQPVPTSTGEPVVESAKEPVEPRLETTEVLTGLRNPWDIVFLPDNTILFNERSGTVGRVENGAKVVVADIGDVYATGEGGLTGLALDADFKQNRYLYTCFNARTASGLDVRLVRWRLSEDNKSLTERRDIVTGIPSGNSGRHSGCRVKSDAEGNLWVGTGDAANAKNPQDPQSLGGKILHVTRDGMPAGNNLPAPFDPRIFSYGHRNVQGIVLFEEPVDGVYGYSVEHGSDRDDEINLLKAGNFGWSPRVTYVERGIAMTDLQRFPDAITSIWSSGSPTIAPSGATLLTGRQWGTFNGSMAMAVLKGKQLRIMHFNADYSLVSEKSVLEDFGRIRSATQGPDGNLYITTDNGRNDEIIKVVPTGNQ